MVFLLVPWWIPKSFVNGCSSPHRKMICYIYTHYKGTHPSPNIKPPCLKTGGRSGGSSSTMSSGAGAWTSPRQRNSQQTIDSGYVENHQQTPINLDEGEILPPNHISSYIRIVFSIKMERNYDELWFPVDSKENHCNWWFLSALPGGYVASPGVRGGFHGSDAQRAHVEAMRWSLSGCHGDTIMWPS